MQPPDLCNEDCSWVEQLRQRVTDLETRFGTLSRELRENTEQTQSVKADTAEMLTILHNAKGAFALLKMLGVVAKWLAGLVLSGAILLSIWRGKLPTVSIFG